MTAPSRPRNPGAPGPNRDKAVSGLARRDYFIGLRTALPLRPSRMRSLLLPAAALALGAPAAAAASPSASPLAFFDGRTVSEGTTKIVMRKPYRTHSQGVGRIEPDGTLLLVQQVEEGAEPRKERRWRIRQVAPDRFAGTMSDAVGPVSVEKVGPRFRFRFRMKGGLSVEQWLEPLADGRTATSTLTVRKLGIAVATGKALIRRITHAAP